MRKLTYLALLMLLLSTSSWAAQEKLQGWCQYGGQTVTVGGVASTDTWQESYPSCTVTVYDTGTVNAATIYSDEGVTPKANPFVADSTGYWFFYAADGDYDVKFSGGGIPVAFTLSDFKLFASGSGISSLGGLTGATQTFGDDTNVTMVSAGTAHTLTWAGQLAVGRGGTGAATFTDNGVLLGNVAAAIQVTAAGTADQVLRIPGGGGAPVFGTVDISKAAAVTGALAIANGGTGQTAKTAAFDALAPTTTKGDVIVSNGSDNLRLAIGSDGQCFQADSGEATGTKWGTCLSTSPVPVASGGTGAATLTGILEGNGTSAVTALTSSVDLQLLRRQPNQTAATYHFNSPPYLVTSDFDFPSQQPGGTLTGGVGGSPTLTPCPIGVAGANTGHYVYLSGGVGAAEAVLITGGTCTSGAASGTITFTPVNSHSGAWTITSATDGVQEAVCYLPSGNNIVQVPQGTTTLNADVSWCGETNAVIRLSNGLTLAGTGSLPTETATAFIIDHRTRAIAGSCSKTTIPYTNTAFQAASTTADITLLTMPQFGKIRGLTVKHSAQFTDGGGAMTDVSVSVGDGTTPFTQHTAAFSIGEVTAAADTTFQDTNAFQSTTMASGGSTVSAHFIATNRDFGDGAGSTYLTAGSVDLYVCYELID
jgi:hypothetical protein